LTTFVALDVFLFLFYYSPGITSALNLDGLIARRTYMISIIHPISGISDKVAIRSSQKKKLNLKSSTTQELIKISIVNKRKEILSPP